MDPDRLFEDAFWQRLADYERPQFYEYVQLITADPEAICQAFNPSRRREFMRLLAKGLGLPAPDE
jgi:hypothetical protein